MSHFSKKEELDHLSRDIQLVKMYVVCYMFTIPSPTNFHFHSIASLNSGRSTNRSRSNAFTEFRNGIGSRENSRQDESVSIIAQSF